MSADPREAQSHWPPRKMGSWEDSGVLLSCTQPFWVGGLTEASKRLGIQDSDPQWRDRGCRLTQQPSAYRRQTAGRGQSPRVRPGMEGMASVLVPGTHEIIAQQL